MSRFLPAIRPAAASPKRPLVAQIAAVASLLLGAPALAAPRPPAPAIAVDPADAAALKLARCLGHEDPGCGRAALEELKAAVPAGSASLDMGTGIVELLAGRWGPAKVALQKVAGLPTAPAELRERAAAWVEVAEASAEVMKGAKSYKLAGGKVEVWLRPGPDEVLLAYLETVLSKALPKLESAFGALGSASPPIQLHVYPRAVDLARVSGLTLQQVRTSGTIALCKHNRVMITSPQDLLFGYAWADTVVHELVHWFVIKRGGPQVPVWMHEGLARALQGSWRGAAPGDLDPDEKQILAAARKKNAWIGLARMYPSLAVLPSQDQTQLAFAEVHLAVLTLLRKTAGAAGAPPSEPLSAAGQLVARFGQGQSEAAVIQELTGLSSAAFAAACRREWQTLDLRDVSDAPTAKVPLVFKRGSAAGPVLAAEAKRFSELGDRLAVQRRPLAAAIEYRKALAAAPQSGPWVVARLVRVLLDLGKPAEALDYLQPALQSMPDHAPLYVLSGRLAVLQSRWRDALEALEQAAWLNPYDPQVHSLSAQAHAALGQEGEAAAARARLALVESAGL